MDTMEEEIVRKTQEATHLRHQLGQVQAQCTQQQQQQLYQQLTVAHQQLQQQYNHLQGWLQAVRAAINRFAMVLFWLSSTACACCSNKASVAFEFDSCLSLTFGMLC